MKIKLGDIIRNGMSLGSGTKPAMIMPGKPVIQREATTLADQAYQRDPEHLARLEKLIERHSPYVEKIKSGL